MHSDPSAVCPRCGSRGGLVTPDAQCPGCLLTAALGFVAEAGEHPDTEPIRECDGYEVVKTIGRGGHGVVFLAHRPGSERLFALKMLASAKLAGPHELRRFRLEAESLLELDHRHIVGILGAGESEGSPYYVMEYAPGGTLADRLKAPTRDTGAEVSLLIKVARAVQFAHERGILHRDLKPANILFDQAGEPLVSDFGLARLVHAPSGLTMTGAALGTPSYMAPEQAAGGGITIAVDIYSLGAILFHQLTGRPPFEGETPLEILGRVMSQDAPDPRRFDPGIDQDLASICQTALHREPSRRYASAAVLADDLERWQRGEPVLARPVTGWEKLMKWRRRHPVTAMFVATGSVAALALSVVLTGGSILLRQERDYAVKHEAIARENARIAGENARAAIQARNESQINSYAADLYLAYRAFDDGHLGQARNMLARHVPQPGENDLRGFEWFQLARRCRGDDLKVWNDHSSPVTAVAFSPDGKVLASAGRDGKVYFRSFPEGRVVQTLPPKSVPKGSAEISYLAKVVVNSAAMSRHLLMRSVNSDEFRMRSRPSRLGDLSHIAWAPDGKRFLTAGLGSYARIWTYPECALVGLIPAISFSHVGFSADGERVCLILPPGELRERHELQIYACRDLSWQRSVTNLPPVHALSPDGRLLATAPEDGGTIELRDLVGSGASVVWPVGVGMGVKQLAFAANGQTLHGREAQGTFVRHWRVADGHQLGQSRPAAGMFDRWAVSPDGRRLASNGGNQLLMLQAADGDPQAGALRGHEDVINALAFSRDGKYLITGGNDHSCRLWSGEAATLSTLVAAKPESRNETKPGEITAHAPGGFWTGDGEHDGRLSYHPDQGPAQDFIGPPGRYLRLSASLDGRFLSAFSWPRNIRVLDIGQRQWGDSIALATGTVGPVIFSPDSQWLVSGGDDNTISIRRRQSGELVKSLRGHQGPILDLAFTPDGRTLASSAADRSLRLWHPPTWRELGTLHRGENLKRLVFSTDGRVLRASVSDQIDREFSGADP